MDRPILIYCIGCSGGRRCMTRSIAEYWIRRHWREQGQCAAHRGRIFVEAAEQVVLPRPKRRR